MLDAIYGLRDIRRRMHRLEVPAWRRVVGMMMKMMMLCAVSGSLVEQRQARLRGTCDLPDRLEVVVVRSLLLMPFASEKKGIE